MTRLFSEEYWQKKRLILNRAKAMPMLASSKFISSEQLKRIQMKDVEVLFSSQNRKVDDLPYLGQSVFVVSTIFEDTDYFHHTFKSILELNGCGIPVIYFIKEASKTSKCREIVYSMVNGDGFQETDITVMYCLMSDSGMYEGLRQSFEFIKDNHSYGNSLMTYINGDDVLEPNSVLDVLDLSNATGARWITGISQVIDEDSNLLFSHKILFDQIALRKGLHVGGRYPFVMQEGTFWTLSLYKDVQGFDVDLRLAGDYDLWVQFSQIEHLVSTGKPNAAFRKRAGQKSEDLASYMEEMAISRQKRGLEYDIDTWNQLIQADFPDTVRNNSGFKISSLMERSIGYYYVHQGKFKPYFDKPIDDPLFSYPIHVSVLEARYPNNLLQQMALDHEIHDKHHGIESLDLDPDTHGFYTYYLLRDREEYRFKLNSSSQSLSIVRLRIVAIAATKSCTLILKCNGRERQYSIRTENNEFTFQDIYQDFFICEHLRPDAIFHASINGCSWAYISIHRNHTPLPIDFGFYGDIDSSLCGWPYLTKVLPKRKNDLHKPELPLISIVIPTCNQADTIRDTLASIFNQGYPDVQVIVLDGCSTDATREILSDYLSLLSICISAPDGGQSEAIAKGLELAKGEIVTWLNTDDMYFPFCLHMVSMTYYESAADMIVGNCLVFKKGEYSFIHSPNVTKGILSAAEILDINNFWLKGKYFHQPEVFFTQAALEKVRRVTGQDCINQDLYYSMDYDLWAKMAISGCAIERINATLAIYRMSEVQKTSTVDNYLPELTAHAAHLKGFFNVNINQVVTSRLESWQDLHVLLFNDIGFFGGAGVAHERIAKSLASYGVKITCLAVSDHWTNEGHTIDIDRLLNLIDELKPHIIICGNIHGIDCDHYLLLTSLCRVYPCCFIAHDFWITNGNKPYPTLDPLNPLGEVGLDASSWITRINLLENLYVVPNSKFCEKVLVEAGLKNVITNSGFLLCDASVLQFRLSWISSHKLARNGSKIKMLMGSVGLSEQRKGAHIVLDVLKDLPSEKLHCLEIGTYGFTPVNEIATYCDYKHHGFIESHQMCRLLSEYDAYISASLIETFGQTALEAIGLGKLVLVTKSGGHTEYAIDGVNAVIIDSTVEAMMNSFNNIIAAGMHGLNEELSSSSIYRSLSVAKFSHERQGSALLKICDEILGGVLPAGGQRVSLELPNVVIETLSK